MTAFWSFCQCALFKPMQITVNRKSCEDNFTHLRHQSVCELLFFRSVCTSRSNDTHKRLGHLAEQSPLSLSFKLVFVLLWRISFSSVLLSSPLFPSFFSLSSFDAMMEMCVPGGPLIKTQGIWLLISDKNITLFVVQRKRSGWGFTQENLPSPLPTKSRLRPLPSKRNVNQTRAWGLLKRSSSGGHCGHCVPLMNGEDNPMCPTDLTLD